MARDVYVMDITDFRPLVSVTPLRFLRWVTRGFREEGQAAETAAAAMQASRGKHPGAIELVGAWYAVGVTGHQQFRAFSLYACHGGWAGGWRRMVELYQGVPDSLFLSPIDGVRFTATSVPLVAAPGSPAVGAVCDGSVRGPFAVVEFTDVRTGAGLDYLAAVTEQRRPVMADYGFQLAGAYEVAFSRRQVCTLWCGGVDGHVGLLRARDAARGLDDAVLADDRLVAWERTSAAFLDGDSRELMLAAFAGPPLSPAQ
ncbi:hypothetical protein [Streptomyces spiralis]|uniref:hypothetical protein n=1 Tax=Streptomyces spiralis TaxID=66376 RepID=UPI0033EE2C04